MFAFTGIEGPEILKAMFKAGVMAYWDGQESH